jgi:hypothetical protein
VTPQSLVWQWQPYPWPFAGAVKGKADHCQICDSVTGLQTCNCHNVEFWEQFSICCNSFIVIFQSHFFLLYYSGDKIFHFLSFTCWWIWNKWCAVSSSYVLICSVAVKAVREQEMWLIWVGVSLYWILCNWSGFCHDSVICYILLGNFSSLNNCCVQFCCSVCVISVFKMTRIYFSFCPPSQIFYSLVCVWPHLFIELSLSLLLQSVCSQFVVLTYLFSD